jgi:hypothetical protein
VHTIIDIVYISSFVYTGRAPSKALDDHDDFIVPSDSEVETRSMKSSSSGSSGATFLAAAEQRELGKKEKKAAESRTLSFYPTISKM